MVEFLFAAEQLTCQARQIVDLPAMQAAALDLEEGGRLGDADPSLASPCWQIIGIWKASSLFSMLTKLQIIGGLEGIKLIIDSRLKE